MEMSARNLFGNRNEYQGNGDKADLKHVWVKQGNNI